MREFANNCPARPIPDASFKFNAMFLSFDSNNFDRNVDVCRIILYDVVAGSDFAVAPSRVSVASTHLSTKYKGCKIVIHINNIKNMFEAEAQLSPLSVIMQQKTSSLQILITTEDSSQSFML